jgi:hypothetical protein
MSALSTWAVEQARPDGERKNFEEARDLATVLREVEQRLVFEQIAFVKIRRPPLRLTRCQKNTGSR